MRTDGCWCEKGGYCTHLPLSTHNCSAEGPVSTPLGVFRTTGDHIKSCPCMAALVARPLLDKLLRVFLSGVL